MSLRALFCGAAIGLGAGAQAGAAETEPEQWTPPDPPAAAGREDDRQRMVRDQIAEPSARRKPVEGPRVLDAMRTVPRHAFVPNARRAQAYADRPLPIGEGQTISQPYVVAYMTAQLDLEAGDKVLEVGTGSGYQAAVLGHLTPHVYSIEIIETLAKDARKDLRNQNYDHVKVKNADGYQGWEKHAPFDAIIVTAAAAHLPPPLWKQLEPGGRLVMPLGGPYAVQRLVRMTKTGEGERRSRTLMTVRFVPMTGEAMDGENAG